MSKSYFQSEADAAEYLARSYECNAHSAQLRGEDERHDFYIRMAASSRKNRDVYQSLADDDDQG